MVFKSLTCCGGTTCSYNKQASSGRPTVLRCTCPSAGSGEGHPPTTGHPQGRCCHSHTARWLVGPRGARAKVFFLGLLIPCLQPPCCAHFLEYFHFLNVNFSPAIISLTFPQATEGFLERLGFLVAFGTRFVRLLTRTSKAAPACSGFMLLLKKD